MADVKAAVEDVLRWEDATLSGVITDTRGDSGGKTRFGLASKWHKELLATNYYSSMSTADALQIAVLTLTHAYALPLEIALIKDQALATKFLSYGVNAGTRRAVEAMQRAINGVYPGSSVEVAVDGAMGVDTLMQLNRCMPASLLNSFRLQMIADYARDCQVRPVDLEFLLGWLHRSLA